jgi:uncharacterized membrane protein
MFFPSQKISPEQRMLVVAVYMATTVVALSVAGAALLAPWLASRGSGLAAGLYHSYAQICHQNPSRCFVLFGHPVAACGRCLGIYIGFLAGCLVYPLARSLFSARVPRPRMFVLLSLPLGLDVLANMLHFWDFGNWFRFSTGVVWGFILPFYFLAGLTDLIVRRLAFRRPTT